MRPTLVSGWRRLALLTLPLLLGGGVIVGALALHTSTPAAVTTPLAAGQLPAAVPPAVGLLVHVSGAVVHPGIYRLQRGDRASDAIAAAGGLAAQADPARLPDLAGRLRDGQQVKVPFLKTAAGGSISGAKADLNTATAEELATIPGFTSDLAAAVVAQREQFGPFSSIRELVTVLGMGAAEYAQAKKHVRV